MKKIILLMFCIFTTAGMIGQESSENKKNRRHAIGISAGTGLAFDYSYKLNEVFSLTARYNIFKYGYDFTISQEEQEFDVTIETDYKGYDIALSIHPFKNAFRIIGGYGRYDTSNLKLSVPFDQTLNLGDVELSSDNDGELKVDVIWKENLPYAGIAFGRAVPKRRIGYGIELGTYFGGSPDITIKATGVDQDFSEHEELLADELEKITYLSYIPYIKLRLSYALF